MSPLLLNLVIHDCHARSRTKHIFKYVDDTTAVDLIGGDDDKAYRGEVEHLMEWRSSNNLVLKRKRLRRAHVLYLILTTFYRGTVESMLTYCISIGSAGCKVSDRKALQRVMRTAEKIIFCFFSSPYLGHS